jgi:hypothetical protein
MSLKKYLIRISEKLVTAVHGGKTYKLPALKTTDAPAIDL